jgi:hypothetical protein
VAVAELAPLDLAQLATLDVADVAQEHDTRR